MYTLRKTAKMSKLVAKARFSSTECRKMRWFDKNGLSTDTTDDDGHHKSGFGDPKTTHCLEPFETFAIGLDPESIEEVRAGKIKNAKVRDDLTAEEALAEAALVIEKIGPNRFATGLNGGVDLDQRDLAWKKYAPSATMKDDAKIRWMMQHRLEVCVELGGQPDKVVEWYNEHLDEIEAEDTTETAEKLEQAQQADSDQAA